MKKSSLYKVSGARIASASVLFWVISDRARVHAALS
jgi:hypothetical protein